MPDYTFSIQDSSCCIALHNNRHEKLAWEDRYKYSHYKILTKLFKFMKDRGFTVKQDQKVDKVIRPDYFRGRKGDLEFKSERYPAGFRIEFYQNISFESPNGGEYDFNKLEKMPYLIKLSYLNEINKIKDFLKSFQIEDVSSPEYKLAEDCIKYSYVESCHYPQTDMNFKLSDLDGETNNSGYNCEDRDGKKILNGQIKYFRDYDGRLRRCKVYHNLNNMWWCILNDMEYTNKASFSLFDATEEDFKVRRVVKDTKPLLKAKTDYGDKLVQVWENFTAKRFYNAFKLYMEGRGIEKENKQTKIGDEFYEISNSSWARVECFSLTKRENSSKINFCLTLRKQGGSYLILEYKGERIFEVDYTGVNNFNEPLLIEFIESNKLLFDMLFLQTAKVNKTV